MKRGGEGKNNHERDLSFHVILLWRVGKSPYDESTPGAYANLQKRTQVKQTKTGKLAFRG